MNPMNPYVINSPVGNTQAFVGRADALQEVERMLNHAERNALLLFGPRRSGKSSTLAELVGRLPSRGQFWPVCFDLQERARQSLDRIASDLARSIAAELALPAPNLGERAEVAFRDQWLPSILRQLPEGHVLVLLFDEFEASNDPGALRGAQDFYTWIRPWLDDPNHRLPAERIRLVFAIGRNVADLTSSALGFFRSIPLVTQASLTRLEVDQIVSISHLEGGLHWDPMASDMVWALAQGHPAITQALCFRVWARAHATPRAHTPSVSHDDVMGAADELVADAPGSAAASMMEWIWSGLTPSCQHVVSALAASDTGAMAEADLSSVLRDGVRVTVPELAAAPRLLLDWDLIEVQGDAFRIRCEILRRWVRRNKPTADTRAHPQGNAPRADRYYDTAMAMWADCEQDIRSEDVPQVVSLARRALKEHPRHIGALGLIAEIHQARGEEKEAFEILEQLLDIDPVAGRRRLVPIMLDQARRAADDSQRLQIFDRILELEPNREEARKGRREVFIQRAEQARESGDFDRAEHWYGLGEMPDLAGQMREERRRREMAACVTRIGQLTQERRHEEAMAALDEAARRYPEAHYWAGRREELESAVRIRTLFEQGHDALVRGELKRARTLLAQVAGLDPTYPDVARYLYQAVTGRDPEAMRSVAGPEAIEPDPIPVAAPPTPTPPPPAPQPKVVRFEPMSVVADLPTPGSSLRPPESTTQDVVIDESVIETSDSSEVNPQIDPQEWVKTSELSFAWPAPDEPQPRPVPPPEPARPLEPALETRPPDPTPSPEPLPLQPPEPPLVSRVPAKARTTDPGEVSLDSWSVPVSGSRIPPEAPAAPRAVKLDFETPSTPQGKAWTWAEESDPSPSEGGRQPRQRSMGFRIGATFVVLILVSLLVVLVGYLARSPDGTESTTTAIPAPPSAPTVTPSVTPPPEPEPAVVEPVVESAPVAEPAPAAEPTPTSEPKPVARPLPVATPRPAVTTPPATQARSATSASTDAESPWTTTPPPVGKMGRFSVTSDPQGVSVYLDAKKVGTTPLVNAEFAAGEYIFRLAKDGYMPVSFMGEIRAGQTRDLGNFNLTVAKP